MRVSIITASDSGAAGLREDQSGPLIREFITKRGDTVVSYDLLPDDRELLGGRLAELADGNLADLILTTGGTGFAGRDVTPEATLDVVNRRAPGIPEAMRAYSLGFTGRAMLSRAEAGIRRETLIVNLPGSPKAVGEVLDYLYPHLSHGVSVLTGADRDCGRSPGADVRVHAVCVAQERGQLKREVPEAHVVCGQGIRGDGHCGDWGRQVTCLDWDSVLNSNRKHSLNMGPGDFAENISIEHMAKLDLQVGDRFRLGESVELIVTQIGKPDHPSIVTRTFGVTLLPQEGRFCRVVQGGIVKKGDPVAKMDSQEIDFGT